MNKGKLSNVFNSYPVFLGCFTHDEMVLVTKSKESAQKWQSNGFQRAYQIDAYLREGK